MTDVGFGKMGCFPFCYLSTRKKPYWEGILEGDGGAVGRGVSVCLQNNTINPHLA